MTDIATAIPTVRERLEEIRDKAAKIATVMQDVEPVVRNDPIASALAASLVPSVLLIQHLCDALLQLPLGERETETAEGQLDNDALARWSRQQFERATAHTTAGSAPKLESRETASGAEGQSSRSTDDDLPHVTVPPTPARLERFIVKNRRGVVAWNQKHPPRCFEEWDTDNPDDAPFVLHRLVELRSGEEISNDRLTMIAEINRLQFCVGVQQKRAEAAEQHVKILQEGSWRDQQVRCGLHADFAALKVEHKEAIQQLTVMASASPWTDTAASQGWVEGVVEEIEYGKDATGMVRHVSHVIFTDLPVSQRVLIRVAEPVIPSPET